MPSPAAPPPAKPAKPQGFSGLEIPDNDEPIVPSSGGGLPPIKLPTIGSPAAEPAPPPARQPQGQQPRQDDPGGGTPPAGELSDEEMLEMARRAAGKQNGAGAKNEPPPAKKPDDQQQPPEEGDIIDPPPAPPTHSNRDTNLANLRKSLEASKAEEQRLAARVAELEKLEQKSKEFAGFDEERKSLQEQIQKLTPFRDLLAIQQSPVFIESFIRPVDEAKAELQKLAKDYSSGQAGENEINELISIAKTGSKKELNDRLADLFGVDETLPINEAKSHLAKIVNIEAKRIEAEKVPSETLKEIKLAREKAEAERIRNIALAAKQAAEDGWEIATRINTSEKHRIPALVEIPGEKEHNERRSQILKDARALQQQSINLCLQYGGQVPREFASFLASQAQLATCAGVYQQEADYFRRELERVEAELATQRGIDRPGARTAPRTVTRTPPAPKGDKEVAATIWNQVVEAGNGG